MSRLLFRLSCKMTTNLLHNKKGACINNRNPGCFVRQCSSDATDRATEVAKRAEVWLARLDKADIAGRLAAVAEMILAAEDIGERRYRQLYWEEKYTGELKKHSYMSERAHKSQRHVIEIWLHSIVDLVIHDDEVNRLVLDFYQKRDPATDAKVAKKKFDSVFKPTYKPMAELRKVVEDPTIQKVLWKRLGLGVPLPNLDDMWYGDLSPKSDYRPAHVYVAG